MTTPSPAWAPPGYRNIRELGRGAQGIVCLAFDERSYRQVAIKYLKGPLARDPHFLGAFREEAALLTRLRSPHISPLLQWVEHPTGCAIVMELAQGITLSELIEHGGALPLEASLAVLKGSLLGLAEAHRAGVVHRDYKPGNVIVGPEGVSRLLDFGIAARSGERAGLSGSAPYMAPEQWRQWPASPASDVYAATATFYQCLTGHPPFPGPGPDQYAAQHLYDRVPEHGSLPPTALRLIRSGLAKLPEERPRGAQEFAVELDRLACGEHGGDWERRGQQNLAAWVTELAGRGLGLWFLQESLSSGGEFTGQAPPPPETPPTPPDTPPPATPDTPPMPVQDPAHAFGDPGLAAGEAGRAAVNAGHRAAGRGARALWPKAVAGVAGAAVIAGGAIYLLRPDPAPGDDAGGRSDRRPAAADKASPAPSAGTPYAGPPLPGLKPKATWGSSDDEAWPVGNSIVVLTGEDSASGRTLEFRTASSGRLLRKVPVKGSALPATWHGEPAVEVYTSRTKEASGLDKADTLRTTTVYSATGKQLGKVERAASEGEYTVVDGWLVTQEPDENQKAEISDVRGGPKRKVTCPENPQCQIDVDFKSGSAEMISTGPDTPLVTAGLTFTWQDADDDLFTHDYRLVATDLTTGRKAWDSSALKRPAQALPEAGPGDNDDSVPSVLGDLNGRLLLSWDAEGGWSDACLVGVHDPATGRLKSHGPLLKGDILLGAEQNFTYDRAGTLAAMGSEPTTAWDLKTGTKLWSLEKDERVVTPAALGNGVLYARFDEGEGPAIALNARTKAVLSDKPELDVPRFTVNGHGLVTTDTGFHVFAPDPVS
ncbi:protein kinase [Streptomyces sp. NPDC050418]|uniref:serine/threonine-protein kinase n=1 Tax=Streptomyces sp. NPDC050418 TaxID=3365612 RepID=UPI0037AC8EA5